MSKVKLIELVDAIESHHDELTTFLDKKSGEIIQIDNRIFEIVNQESDYSNYQDWEHEWIHQALEIEEHDDDYIIIPDLNREYSYLMMENFCIALPKNLYCLFNNSIKGKGAYKRFNQLLVNYNLLEKWYAFKHQSLIEIAKEWCMEQNLEFEENL